MSHLKSVSGHAKLSHTLKWPLTPQESSASWRGGGRGCFSHKVKTWGQVRPTGASAPWMRGAWFSCDGWVVLKCQAPLGQAPQQGRHHLGKECQGWPEGGDLCPNLRFKWLRQTLPRRGGSDGFAPLFVQKESIHFCLWGHEEDERDQIMSESSFFPILQSSFSFDWLSFSATKMNFKRICFPGDTSFAFLRSSSTKETKIYIAKQKWGFCFYFNVQPRRRAKNEATTDETSNTCPRYILFLAPWDGSEFNLPASKHVHTQNPATTIDKDGEYHEFIRWPENPPPVCSG